MIDSHSHLNDEIIFNKREKIIQSAIDCGVTKIIVPSYNLESNNRTVFLANNYNIISGAVGIHPLHCEEYNDLLENKLKELIRNPAIVAVGEIGLDYHYKNYNKKKQQEVFIKQLKIARLFNKPVIIHSRNSAEDTIDILFRYAKGIKGVIHCFSYSKEVALLYIKKIKFYISLSGVVTFKNAKNAIEVAGQIPLEYLLIETDAPYLTPYPFRNLLNEPKYLIHILKKIKEIRLEPSNIINNTIVDNTKKLFNI